jgi:hypothetical protein
MPAFYFRCARRRAISLRAFRFGAYNWNCVKAVNTCTARKVGSGKARFDLTENFVKAMIVEGLRVAATERYDALPSLRAAPPCAV